MNYKRIFILITFVAFLLTAFGFQTSSEFKILFEKAKFTMETKGDLKTAINLFNEIIKKYPSEREYAARSQFLIGQCYEKLGNDEARKAYESVLRDYAEQSGIVNEAKARLEALGTQQPKSSHRQIWAGPDVNTDGAPSPDGRYISYVDHKKDFLAIYDTKTSESKILSDHYTKGDTIWIEESIWSPDGKQLAYEFNSWLAHAEIHLVNVDGSGHRVLCTKTDLTATYINFLVKDWSRDGKLILATFSRGSKLSPGGEKILVTELAVISVDDGSIRVIKTLDGFDWGLPTNKMVFSPDSRFIVYSYPNEKKSKALDIFIIGIDGRSELNITQHPADDRVIGWEPNGNRLLFLSDRGGTNNLWATQIFNGKPQGFPKIIWNNIGKISPMGLTNNGSLYYSVKGAQTSNSSFRESNIYMASLDPQTGKIISAPAAATMNNNGFNHVSNWSPDGTKLLYLSYFANNSSKRRNLYILSPETGSEKEVLHQLGADSSLYFSNWFHDGKHLAAVAQLPDGEVGIYKLEIETGSMIPLVINKDTVYFSPYVSPDGKILFFQSNAGGIYSYDLERKERRLLFQTTKYQQLQGHGLSSDGRQLAFAIATSEKGKSGSTALMVMPSSGGEPRAIYQIERTNFFITFVGIRWSPDGQFIYLAKRSEKGDPFELFRVPVQGGTPESTGLVSEGLHFISVRPDGKEIAFCAGLESKTKPGIWVLENIFAEKEKVESGKK